MSEKLTWHEIQKRYQGEWVELVECDWDETVPDPRAGVVRIHAKDAKEFHRLLVENPVSETALAYVGNLFPKIENII